MLWLSATLVSPETAATIAVLSIGPHTSPGIVTAPPPASLYRHTSPCSSSVSASPVTTLANSSSVTPATAGSVTWRSARAIGSGSPTFDTSTVYVIVSPKFTVAGPDFSIAMSGTQATGVVRVALLLVRSVSPPVTATFAELTTSAQVVAIWTTGVPVAFSA